MTRESADPRSRRSQVGGVRSDVAPVHRATDRDDPARISGSDVLLEFGRSAPEAPSILRLLQRRSRSSLAQRRDAHRACRPPVATACGLRRISMDTALWRSVPDAGRRLIGNSHPTGVMACPLLLRKCPARMGRPRPRCPIGSRLHRFRPRRRSRSCFDETTARQDATRIAPALRARFEGAGLVRCAWSDAVCGRCAPPRGSIFVSHNLECAHAAG